MPQATASQIRLSERQEQILSELSKSTQQELHFKVRSEIILQAARGCSNNEIERNMNISKRRVRCWRDRYSTKFDELAKIEEDTPHKLRAAIKETLSDEQRSGTPATFRDEQVAAIIALACSDPMEMELPFSHWSSELLRQEAIKLKIVDNISARQVSRFLKRRRNKATFEPMLVEP